MKTKFISRPNFKKNNSVHSKFGIIVAADINSYKLNEFITQTINFLNNETTNYNIFIMNESKLNYNRNKLYNIGYDIAKKNNCDYVIFHNENIIPNDNMLGYYTTYPRDPINLTYKVTKNSLDAISINMIDFEQCGGFNMHDIDSSFLTLINKNNMTIYLPSSGSYSVLENNNLNRKNKFKINKSNLYSLKYSILEHQILNDTTFYYYIK